MPIGLQQCQARSPDRLHATAGSENDLVKWTESFMSEQKVRLFINGQEGSEEVNTGIPQGSSASPILFTAYLSGLFGYVKGKSRASRPYPSSTTSRGRWRRARRLPQRQTGGGNKSSPGPARHRSHAQQWSNTKIIKQKKDSTISIYHDALGR